MASKQLNASKPALFNELAELEKLRTSLGRFQTERRTLADENSQLKAEIAALKEEIATLSSENAQLLAQADARAQLMQSIQSTLGPRMWSFPYCNASCFSHLMFL
jgi:predicted nuclease with TOPRIM domain